MLASAFGHQFKLASLFADRDEITVGRHNDNGLVLNASLGPEGSIPDSLVLQLSRSHARLAVKDGYLQLMDKGTMNGTYVNNLRLPPQQWRVLKHGDLISFGGTNPIETNAGVIRDNPWSFKVKAPEEFLAQHVSKGVRPPPSSVVNVNSHSAGQTTAGSSGSREVYTFSSSHGRSRPEPVRAVPVARVMRPAVRVMRPAQNTEVIDLTLDDDSPPANKKTSAKRFKAGGQDPAASTFSAPSVPSSVPTQAGAAEKAAADTSGGIVDQLKEEFTCPICQELVVAAYAMVPCGHVYCGECLSGWLANKNDCPTCRQKCTAPPVRQNAVDNIINKAAITLPAAEKSVFEERKGEWETNRASFEEKLKKLSTGARAQNRNTSSMMQGLGIPGLDFLFGGLGGPMELPPHLAANLLQIGAGVGAGPQRRNSNPRNQPRQQPRTSRAPAPRPSAVEQQYTVSYAAGGGSRSETCTACRRGFNHGEMHLGMRPLATSARAATVNPWRYYHFDCFPAGAWPNARTTGIANLRGLTAADQSRLRDRMMLG